MQATIDDNRQYSDEKMNKLTEYLTEIIASMMDQIKTSISSQYYKNSPKSQDPTNFFPANKKALPLEGGNSKKIGGMWTLKYDISSPKFYELFIQT